MKILAIDTSCDETAVAITDGTNILANTIWSQASAHAKFGGVMPSLAQRMHEERIDFVIAKALKNSKTFWDQIDAVAVTIGPGLSIALGVGVNKAKELAKKYGKPLIPVNHIEAHLFSPLALNSKQLSAKPDFSFPSYGLCLSGKNTIFVLIKNIGDYEILAQTVDDALGEALDKAARMLGLGYPGGAVLEKMAKLGDPKKFILTIPLVGQEKRQIFSYSGLKTSLHRLIETNKQSLPDKSGKKTDKNFPSKQDIYDLAASFQDVAFKHIERAVSFYLSNHANLKINKLLLGGGVAANIEIRKRLRSLGAKFGYTLHIPYSQRLCGDNAAMIGVCAYLKNKDLSIEELNSKYKNFVDVDRNARLKLV